MERILDVMKDYWLLTAGVIVIVILLIIVIIINLKKEKPQTVEEPKKEEPKFENLVEPQVNNFPDKEEIQNVAIEPEIIADIPAVEEPKVEPMTIEPTVIEEPVAEPISEESQPIVAEPVSEEPQMIEETVEEAFKPEETTEQPESIDFWDMNK